MISQRNDTCHSKFVSKTDPNDDFILLTKEPLDTQQAQSFVSTPRSGAISLFIGTSRNHFNGKEVLKLEYECYENMAYKELSKICQSMRDKWTLDKICVFHRLGYVGIQEASVVVCVSSTHRADAIQATSFCIDALKCTVPIWKKEMYKGGTGEWKQNCEDCQGNKPLR